MHYLLFYELADDYLTRRPDFREPHLQLAWQAHERGELVLGGALADPVDHAILMFKGDSPRVAEEFAKADSYVANGLIKRWYVRPWNTVVGETASTPIRPKTMKAPSPGILRMWKARSKAEKFGAYAQHVTGKVFPALAAIGGHRGAYLLKRTAGEAVEVMVLTLWESVEAIRKFAGSDVEKAVVEPEAQAVLTDFDKTVAHFEIVKGMVDRS